MKTRFRQTWVPFLITALAGGALHFVYTLLPGFLTALLAPVNESVWEHGKLIYWPFLAAALWLTRRAPERRAPYLLSLLAQFAALVGFGYLYDIRLYGESGGQTWVHLICYAVILALGFFVLPGLFAGAAQGWRHDAVWLAVLTLGAAIVLFTFFPPDGVLFSDLRCAKAWAVIPY